MYIGMVVPARYAPGFTVDETLITVGATWSTVTAKISEAFPVLPAASVALAVIAWFPVASVVAIVNVPVLAVPVAPAISVPLSNSVTTLASSAVPVTDTAVTFVTPSVRDRPVSVAVVNETLVGAAGGVVSTMIAAPPASEAGEAGSGSE